MQKGIIIQFIIVQLTCGKHLRDFEVRLEKWNTGRVYVAKKLGKLVDPFGPVCKG